LANAQAKLPGELELQRINIARGQEDLAMKPDRAKLLGLQIENYQASKDLTNEQVKSAIALNVARLDESIKKNQTDEAAIKGINDVYAAFGAKGQVDADSIKNMAPARREALLTMAQLLKQFGTTGMPGDPARTLQLLEQGGIPFGDNVPASHRASWEVLKKDYTDAMAKLTAPGAPKLNDKEMDAAIKGYMAENNRNRQYVQGWSPDNKVFTTPSVNSLLEMKDLVTGKPLAETNPLVKAMAPLAVDGAGTSVTRATDGNLMMNTAASMVSRGELTIDQATQHLTELARAIQDNVGKARGVSRFSFGLDTTSFITDYQRNTGFGNSHEKVNLLNSADTRMKLMRQVAGMANQEAITATLPNTAPRNDPYTPMIRPDFFQNKTRGY
jgi:hypothetical protein